MAITLAWPQPNNRMGPGFHYQGTTDLVGPFPQDWQWVGSLFSTGPVEQTIVSGVTVNPILNSFSGLLGYTNVPGTSTFQPTIQSFPPNPVAITETWFFSVQLQRPTGVVEDQTSVPVTLDMTTGLISLLERKQSTAHGYTQTDRDRDLKTSAAVLSAFPLTDLVSEIAEIGLDAQFGCPPMALLVPSAAQLLTGSGTLDRPQGATGVNAYGFVFRTEVVPPGLSVQDGRSLEYPERLAQFLVIRVDAAGNEFVAGRYDFHHDQERMCWGIPFPKRLEYSILPGVSLRFFWLLFPVGQ